MASGFQRELMENRQIEPFVKHVLCIDGSDQVYQAIIRIKRSELCLTNNQRHPTWSSRKNRHPGYKRQAERDALRQRIVDELMTLERLGDDDETKLGTGGAKPRNTEPRCGREVFLIVGLPASGKSWIASRIADLAGAYIIDSDLAKRKLPEYVADGGATLVHRESTELTQTLMLQCIDRGLNMVFVKIGSSAEDIIELSEALVEKEYRVTLVLVELDRKLAAARAFNRYISTGRYVPLALIYDGYANDPTLTYYRMLQRRPELLKGYLHLDNSVNKGEKPVIVESRGIDFLESLFAQEDSNAT